MDFKQEQQFVTSIKRYVSENLSLSQINDEELEEKIEEIVLERIGTEYCSIQQRVSIVQQVYSSIRGFGLLDSIISDDTSPVNVARGRLTDKISPSGKLIKSTGGIGISPQTEKFNTSELSPDTGNTEVLNTGMNETTVLSHSTNETTVLNKEFCIEFEIGYAESKEIIE